MTQFCLMPVANHLYIRKKSIPKTDFRGKPQFIRPAFEKTFSSVKKILFERYDWNHLMTDSLKPIHSIFVKVLCDLACQTLFIGQQGSSQCDILCPFFSK